MQIAQNWRLKGQRYALKGTQCDNCGKVQFPPREVCPHCEAKNPSFYQYEHTSSIAEVRPALRQAAR
jgi:uncharacterized OB-fold protein